MIDFQNKSFLKMKQDSIYQKKVVDLLAHGEEILDSYKSIRDGVVFTTMCIIVVNVQGLTGKKVAYTSIPYKRINVYSVETAGTFEIDAEWISFSVVLVNYVSN